MATYQDYLNARAEIPPQLAMLPVLEALSPVAKQTAPISYLGLSHQQIADTAKAQMTAQDAMINAMQGLREGAIKQEQDAQTRGFNALKQAQSDEIESMKAQLQAQLLQARLAKLASGGGGGGSSGKGKTPSVAAQKDAAELAMLGRSFSDPEDARTMQKLGVGKIFSGISTEYTKRRTKHESDLLAEGEWNPQEQLAAVVLERATPFASLFKNPQEYHTFINNAAQSIIGTPQPAAQVAPVQTFTPSATPASSKQASSPQQPAKAEAAQPQASQPKVSQPATVSPPRFGSSYNKPPAPLTQSVNTPIDNPALARAALLLQKMQEAQKNQVKK